MILILALASILTFPSLSWAALAVANSEECHVDLASVSCTTNAVATTTGSLFVCNASYDGVFTSVTDSEGNSYATAVAEITQLDVSNAHLRQVYKENGTGGAAHTFTLTLNAAGYPTLVCLEVTGAATVSALDQPISSSNAANTAHSSGFTGMTVQADEILISAGATANWADYISDGIFTTAENISSDVDTEGIFVEYRIVSAMNTYQYTYQLSASFAAMAVMATYKQAATGTVVVPTQVRIFE